MAPGFRSLKSGFATLSKKCLDRREWATFQEAAPGILDFIAIYNTYHAHPLTWRKGITFYQRRKDTLARN
jgi:hypothetical protein